MSKYSQDVVRMLYEHQPEYISGQYIAYQLNISRAAVKKVIDQLKMNGCQIESINHKGHLLKQLPINQRQQLAINGNDLMQHLNQQGGPWVKDVLRKVEVAVVTNKVSNTYNEIMKWVDSHVKI